ncbi:MAG TPA: glycosyltransferase [Xanthobacteraceae bacterium]|nr:glycosyltransferase [Xanthobacteraceae bacterium]
MRVLLVHNFYRIPGGEDNIARQELMMLKENGVDVELFSVTNDDIKGIREAISVGVRVVYNFAARRALSRKLAEYAPDVVHIHNFFPLLSPSILDACRDAGVPSVMTMHNFRILCPTAMLGADELTKKGTLRHSCWWTVPKRAYRNSAAATLAVAAMVEFHKHAGTWTRKVDRFIALTEWAKRMFIEGGLPADRIVVKPNCVARPAGLAGSRREGALFVGRLDQQKGLGTVLRAWKDIDYPLKIIGDGPLSELIERTGNDRITYLGRQPWDAVQREMRAAKFLVFASIGMDMFPTTLLEAFSNHLPVICSELPCLQELVKSGVTGLMFPPGDANALAAQVRWAVSNPSALAELSCRAHASYEERYTPEVNFNQLIGIYRSVARDRPAYHRRHSGAKERIEAFE